MDEINREIIKMQKLLIFQKPILEKKRVGINNFTRRGVEAPN